MLRPPAGRDPRGARHPGRPAGRRHRTGAHDHVAPTRSLMPVCDSAFDRDAAAAMPGPSCSSHPRVASGRCPRGGRGHAHRRAHQARTRTLLAWAQCASDLPFLGVLRRHPDFTCAASSAA
ncbi:MAG: hypothetical protein MZW92_72890 [Comamonadaceae bacterium]|nr:hypothetical protein [Comamonadaceae bacterium]